MQLCQGFERNGDGSAVATGSRRTEPLQSIWQFLAREEVQALGDIVRSWTRGDVDGFTARRQLQSRVLRDDMIRNMTGHDRGSPHAIRFRPGGREPQNAWSDTVGEGGGLGHRPQLGQPGSLFSDFESGMFARLAGAASGAPWRLAPGEQGHEVFGTIDTIFGARFFEDARSLAMRELGLDGSSPVPDEVRASFREKATSILQAAPQVPIIEVSAREGAVSARFDLLKLCLCADILRNIRGGARRPASDFAAQQRALSPFSSGAFIRSQPIGGVTAHGRRGLGAGVPGSMDVIFVSGGGGMMVIGVSGGQLGGAGATGFGGSMPFRLDEALLQARIGMLLEILSANAQGRSTRSNGLTMDEIDRQCPIAKREAGDADDGCCPICLEPSALGEEVRRLPCGHRLHRECSDAWLTTADTCPTCRHQVPRGEAEGM